MWDDDAQPWAPGMFFSRVRNALFGGEQVKGLLYDRPDLMRLPTTAHHRIRVGSVNFNPCCLAVDDDLIVVVRTDGNRAYLGRWTGERIDGGLVEVADPVRDLLKCGTGQDIRLFTLGGHLYGVIAVGLAPPSMHTPIRQGVIKFSDDHRQIVEGWLQPGSKLEKNWLPAIVDGTLKLVYSADPLIVFDVNVESMRPTQDVDEASRRAGGGVRGSSQLVPYEGGWLCVVHGIRASPAVGKLYSHWFLTLDHGLTSITGRSKEFYLSKKGIEFVAGLTFWRDRYWISYGVDDCEAYLDEVTPETVQALLRGERVEASAPAVSVKSGGGGGGGTFGDTSGFP